MTEILDLLYQIKKNYEDFDTFDNINICNYCAHSLRANKDAARSCFNKLFVTPTTDCMKGLNSFERSSIKFCMTCITAINLGQISNNKRPQNEATTPLKGRITYLPVDVNATDTFLPENLLNVDSLVCSLVVNLQSKRKSGHQLLIYAKSMLHCTGYVKTTTIIIKTLQNIPCQTSGK